MTVVREFITMYQVNLLPNVVLQSRRMKCAGHVVKQHLLA